jgi:hypothetical protein
MARRKSNPALGTVLLIGATAAAAAAGIGYAAVRIARRTPKKPKKKGLKCEPGWEARTVEGIEFCTPAGEAAPKTRNTTNAPGMYVGSSQYTDWPYKDRYPTASSFATVLRTLGYDPGASLTDSKGKSAITAFQRDFNTVSANTRSWMWRLFTTKQELDSAGIRQVTDILGLSTISTDGRLGAQSINALVAAQGLADGVNLPWKTLVNLKKSEIGPTGKVTDEEDIIIEEVPNFNVPAPKSSLVGGACPSTVRSVLLSYLNGNGNAEGAVEQILTQCDAWDSDPKLQAMLSYIDDVAQANAHLAGMRAVRDYVLESR